MKKLLAEHRVARIIMELWPTAMRRATSCEDALRLLLHAGYTLYETGLKALAPETGPAKELWFSHPNDAAGLCEWYLTHSAKFGLWTDIIAVLE